MALSLKNTVGCLPLLIDRIEDEYTVNGQTFYKLHYPYPENALENIHVVAFMANVQCKASTIKIQDRYDIYKNKSEEQQKKEFENVLEISRNQHTMVKDAAVRACPPHFGNRQTMQRRIRYRPKPTGNICWSYWKNKKVFAQLLKSRCQLEIGPWKISCDAIDPLLGHIPGNLRLVCLYNNVTDHSKLNKDLTDTRPTSLTTEIHDEYWRIVR